MTQAGDSWDNRRLGYPDRQGGSGRLPHLSPACLEIRRSAAPVSEVASSVAPDSHTPHRPDVDEFLIWFPGAPGNLAKVTGKRRPRRGTPKQATPSQPAEAQQPRSKPHPRSPPQPSSPEASHTLAVRPSPQPARARKPPAERSRPSPTKPPRHGAQRVSRRRAEPRAGATKSSVSKSQHQRSAPSMASTPSRHARAPWHTRGGDGRSAAPAAQTPVVSGAQTYLCIWSCTRTGRWSSRTQATRSRVARRPKTVLARRFGVRLGSVYFAITSRIHS